MRSLVYFTLLFCTLISQAAEPLVPHELNGCLREIRAGMAPGEVERLLTVAYPKLKAQRGSWSGDLGYIDFALSDRLSISVAAKLNEKKDVVVHELMLFFVRDSVTKHRIEIRQHWSGPDEKPRGLTRRQSQRPWLSRLVLRAARAAPATVVAHLER
jgi:hypothetical protein